MRLSDRDIKKAIAQGEICITPDVPLENIQGVAIDLQLGHQFRVFSGHKIPYLDLGSTGAQLSESLDRLMSDPLDIPDGERFIIHPGELVLGVTLQSIQLSREYIAWLDGRSSLARLGLMVHATSHRIDPGWRGQVVLEFFNCGRIPLGLAPGMKICAVNFEKLSSPVEFAYCDKTSSKYKNQQGAIASRVTSE